MADRAQSYYVYVFFDASGIPRYVGKGVGYRIKGQLKNTHNRRLRGLIAAANGDPPVVIVRNNITNSQACETEISLISAIGRLDCKKGPLFNLTNGGEGTSGHSQTQETKNKIAAAITGKTRSSETRAKISAAQEWKKTPEGRQKLSASQIGRKATDEAKARMRAAQLGRKMSPEAIAKRLSTLAAKAKERGSWYSEEAMARYRAAGQRQIGKKLSIETREKMSRSSMGYVATEENLKKRAMTRAKVVAERGTIYSEAGLEAIRRAAEKRRGLKPSLDTIEKLKIAQRGRKHSEESKQKRSAALRGMMWVTDGIRKRGVKAGEEIPDGWHRVGGKF